MLRALLLSHCVNLGRVCRDTLLGDNMPQVFDLWLEEGAFLQLGLQTFLLKASQHQFQSLQVLWDGGGVHNNVVKYNNMD